LDLSLLIKFFPKISMKKNYTSTSNPLSFSNQLFKHFKKTANSFRFGVGFLFLVCLNFASLGQTTLSAGDVALIGINSANPDQFSIVLLKNISANTVINFTDNGFTGINTGRTGEGFLTYTSPLSQNAGTVLTWTNGMTITGTGWSSNNPSNFAFNGSGDQLFIFQGSTANWASQSGIALLYGVNYGTALSSTSAAGNTVQPSTTLLPSTSFLNLPTSTNANGYFANGSTVITSLNICGTASALLALTVDPTRWVGTTGVAAVFPTFNNSTTTAFTTTYGTASASQTFPVSGSNLTANLIATAPIGFEVSSDGTTYGSTATFTQSSGTASGSLRIRLAANATITGSYNSQNIVLSSTGATSVNITTASSGNTVTAKALTINGITADNKVYDGNTTATIQGTPAYVGLANSETSSVTGTPLASFANATFGTGKTVTVSGYTAPSTNYSLTQPTGLTANITAKPLTVTGATVANKIYDGNTNATISGATLVGVISPDDVSVSGNGTFASALVADGISVTTSLVLGGTNSGNYSLTQPTDLTAIITRKPLTITGLTANNKAYDGNTTATLSGTATLNGIISGDETNVTLTGTPIATFAQTTVGTEIAVSVVGYALDGSLSGNYTLSQPTGLTANITQTAPVINSTLTASATYGMAAPVYTITATNNPTSFNATGLPNGLTINTTTGEITGTPTSITGSPYSVTISATNSGETGTATLVYTVNQKTLTITTPTASDKVYDGNNSATIIGTLSGIVGADVVNLDGTGTFSQSTFGTNLVVTSTSTLSGANASNYSLTQPTGLTANITAKSLTLPDLTIANRIYDGTNNAPLAGTLALSGIINSDEVFIGSGSFIATFDNKNFGTAKPVTVIGYTLAGAKANNYTLSVPTGLTANITAKVLTVTGAVAANKVYDGNTTTTITESTLVGVINPDVVTITQSGTFTNQNVENGITVTSTSTLAGADAGNYSLTQPTGLTANITTKPLTITGVTANNKNYDGTTTATLSGTAALSGIVSGDESNVTLEGTPMATFSQSAVGNAIAVTVTGFTISGTASGNYSLTQPTGLSANIVAVPAPVVNSALTASATYGTVASTYVITATNSPTSFNAAGLPAGLNINTSTGEITGTPTSITGSPFSVTISATNNGGTGTATLVYTINQKVLTITTPLANNKVYDKTNVATIAGTLNGVFGSDVVIFNGTGTFSQVNVGTSLVVTSTSTLSGADASKYTLTQPTGLTANITAKPLTISNPVAQNKIYDGNINATITGTLVGIISPDIVTFNGTGTFASSAVGNGIAVSSTSTLGGTGASNYSLLQPTGLTANITPAPSLTEVILPQYMQGLNGTNSNRIPFAFRATLNNLNPNATYRYYNSVILGTEATTSNGAGNIIFASNTGSWVRSSGPSLSTVGNYGEFTTDASGSYSGWFITEPSGNATRFIPGNDVFMRIMLNNGAGGTTVTTRLTTTNSVKVINTVAASGANNGTGFRGNSGATPKNFVFVYDNENGTERPLSGSFVESDGTANTTLNSYSSFYSTNVDGVVGAYGVIIPNTNANGVRRIEQRDFSTGAVVGCPATDADGIWTSGANTVNPTGGTTAIAIALNDAPLNTCVVVNTPPTISMNISSTSDYVDGGIATSPASSFTTSSVLSDPTNPIQNFGIDFTISDTETPVASLVVSATSSNVTVVPTANLNLTGSGASRNLKITPTAVGYSNINISVNDGTTTTTFTVNLASSLASTNTSTTRFHTGTSDASTAQMIDNNLMIVGDDENQALRIYNRQNSGLPIKSFDFTSSLGLTDASGGVLREVDIEASAKAGNRIFWLGSHSNASNGNARPNRYRFFATDITGSGSETTLDYVGRYDGLKTDLLAWDANNGHGLGANYLGLNASAATGVTPETANGSGFNIEGFEIAPNNTTAYICFRAPLATTTTRTKALIIPLTNFADLVSGNPTSTTATFGNPILLDLGGRAIREIKKNNNGEYLIIAGPHDGSTGIAPKDFRFYTWTGNATDAPILKAANLTALNVDGSFESIVDVPSPILSTSSIQVLVDNGDALYYGDGTIAKDLPQNNFKKFRSEIVNLGTSALSISTISGTSFCENATVNIAFTSSEIYNTGNTFTAQLSNANGSFSNPTVIGTLTGVNVGTITATIPMGTPVGTGYRIRIMASDLAITGEDNGINLSINPIPTAPIAQTNTQIYTGGSISLSATGCSENYSLNWYKSADDLLVIMPVSPSATTTYYAKCVPTNNTCTSAKSNEVTVTVLSNTQVIKSIVSGNWEEVTTWDLGRIPQVGDIVIIDQNHNVILNNIGLAKELKYNSTGKLLLNSANSQLKIGQ